MAEPLKDDFIDFDVISSVHGATKADGFGRNVTLEQLQEGTIIDVPENDENQRERDDDDVWWTKEELLEQLGENMEICLSDDTPWDEKVNSMIPLVEGQVYKKVIKPGVGEPLTKKNAILFHCDGYLEGVDDPFDSSSLRGRPLLHRLDHEDLLPGLSIGVFSMRLHEKAEILIRPSYAFGELGCPPRIPENSTIIYVVEILRIFDEGSLADFELMTPKELAAVPFSRIFEECDKQRTSGNSYFKCHRFREASLRYNKAIRFLEKYFFKDANEQKQGNEMLSKLYPNLANTLINMKKLRQAMSCCRKALAINPDNQKALLQLGKAKLLNNELNEARIYFQRVNDLSPGSTCIAGYLRKVEIKLKQEEYQRTELFRTIGKGLFSNGK